MTFRGDIAFLSHMLGVTNAQDMVGVVMPHGILFQGGAEGKIRRRIPKDSSRLCEGLIVPSATRKWCWLQ